MKGVTLGGYHSYDTWGLWLREAPKISPPEPQTHYVEIPGMDGSLDLTEKLFGTVKYKDREIEMHFYSLAKRSQWAEIASDMMGKLHGKVVRIILDDDPGYYYQGRVVFESMEPQQNVIPIVMTATVGPYKTSIDGRVKKL